MGGETKVSKPKHPRQRRGREGTRRDETGKPRVGCSFYFLNSSSTSFNISSSSSSCFSKLSKKISASSFSKSVFSVHH